MAIVAECARRVWKQESATSKDCHIGINEPRRLCENDLGAKAIKLETKHN